MKRNHIFSKPLFVFLTALPVLALFVLLYGQVSAQSPTFPSDDDVNAVAKQLYCPVCENIPLDVCPTQACAQWRDLIRQRLAEGWSEQQIKDYFVAQYGDRVLATPPLRGFNWLFIALLAGSFILAIGVFYRVLVGSRKPAPPEVVKPTETQSDPYLARIEEELRKRKEDELG